jgi:hypothetical protein
MYTAGCDIVYPNHAKLCCSLLLEVAQTWIQSADKKQVFAKHERLRARDQF